uniref:Uncharacterized protein n=1 Tax=viral metagenome TaxID=1070528 RepID=A0A6M3L8K2_9ZZZZ
MKHLESSTLAGKTVTIKPHVKHPQNDNFGGSEISIEDWWDKITGGSWMFAQGNPACLVYAMRTGFSNVPVPTDDEVLYGHTKDGLGHLIHISEIAT